MTCDIPDSEIEAFAGGGAVGLERHVAECERCQDRLAGLWEQDRVDIAEKTMRAVRVNVLSRDLMELAIGVFGAFGAALARYTLGEDQ